MWDPWHQVPLDLKSRFCKPAPLIDVFSVEGKGAGFGNLEIIVNGGRVTSHVHTISNEKFQANFIPHDPGRHRVDVKFNGEKVPNSPWFVEVKDPNTPLLAPMLVAMGGKGGNGTLKRNGENGHAEVETKTNGFTSSYNSSNDVSSSLSNNKFSSSTSKLNSEIKQSSLFQQSKKESNLSSSISSNKYESNNFSSSLKTNGTDDLKKKGVSDYEKTEVSNFSSLNTPSLLLGGSTTKSSNLEETRNKFSSSTEHLSSGKATYSTTIERSINTGAGYSSLNKPHEARIKGLNNGGSSTMPKSLSSKGVERKASLHAEPLSSRETGTNRTNGTNSLSSNFTKSTSALASSSSSSLQTSSSTYSAVKSSSNYAATSSLSPPKPAPAPPSPKLPSYKGTADKCKFVGDTVLAGPKHGSFLTEILFQVRHFNAGKPATFEMFAPGAKKSDVEVNIISEWKKTYFDISRYITNCTMKIFQSFGDECR